MRRANITNKTEAFDQIKADCPNSAATIQQIGDDIQKQIDETNQKIDQAILNMPESVKNELIKVILVIRIEQKPGKQVKITFLARHSIFKNRKFSCNYSAGH